MAGWLANEYDAMPGRFVDSVACESPLNCAMNLLFDKLNGLLLLFCSLSEARLDIWIKLLVFYSCELKASQS